MLEDMIHLALKIFLMEQSKFNKYFLILISFFVIYSCQFEWVEERRIFLKKIEFGLSVRDAFKQKSIKYFSQDSSNNNYILNISNLKLTGMTAKANSNRRLSSAIYTGNVWHRRLSPKSHLFRYRVFMLYLDLSELTLE